MRTSQSRRLLPGFSLSILLLAACQANQAVTPPDAPPAPPRADVPTGRASDGSRPAPGARPPVDEHLPKLVRPDWNGTRKAPMATQVLAYPKTWQGDLTVQDLTMVGTNLYTLDRGLQSVPVEGGQWAPVSLGGVSGLSRMASDGLHLYAGTFQGQVVGLDPSNGQSATLATLPSAVTALQVGQNVLWIGTERDGVFRVPLSGGTPQALSAGNASARRVQDLVLGNQAVFTLGDRLWAWPMDGSTAKPVPGTDGATSLTSYRGVAYVGTADGWILRSKDDGATAQPLGQMVDTPLESLGTDGAWLYSSTGNTTYMLDLKGFRHSLCHAGFPATVTNLTVMNGETVLVGTRAMGLTSMPR